MCPSGSGIAHGSTQTWPSLRTAVDSPADIEAAHHEGMSRSQAFTRTGS